MTTSKSIIIDAKRQFLVDVIIVKCPRPSKGGTEIGVEIVSTPESSFATLQVNVIDNTIHVNSRLAMNSQCEHQMSGSPKQTPAVVES